MKLYVALVVLLSPALDAACITPHAPAEANQPRAEAGQMLEQPSKRQLDPSSSPVPVEPGSSLPVDPLLTGPSAIKIDLPPQFLPPPWSPYSGLDSPYPSSGVSPWDDSGRSQSVDNTPSVWRQCPKVRLDCRKCPRDRRCRVAVGNLSDADDDGSEGCPLSKCDEVGNGLVIGGCGTGATCTRGYCVCPLGTTGDGGWRGSQGLGQVTVYVDPGIDCNATCEGPLCNEVQQLSVGMCFVSGTEVDDDDDDDDDDGDEGEAQGSTFAHVGGNATVNGVTLGLGEDII
ncbi:hypothetical protein ACEQ8H_005345 [Pleosporales sp. CAS-2024a]